MHPIDERRKFLQLAALTGGSLLLPRWTMAQTSISPTQAAATAQRIPVVPGGVITNARWRAFNPVWTEPMLPRAGIDLPILIAGEGGRENVPFLAMPLEGPRCGLYEQPNYVARDKTGRLVASRWVQGFGAETWFARQKLLRQPIHAAAPHNATGYGPRMLAKFSAYSWAVPLKDGGYILVHLDGSVQHLLANGRSKDICGNLYKPSRHPTVMFPEEITQLQGSFDHPKNIAEIEAWNARNKELVGVWGRAPHTTPGACIDRDDDSIVYITDFHHGVVHKLNWRTRTAIVLCEGLNHPGGICMTTNRKLIIACVGDLKPNHAFAGTGQEIWRVDPNGSNQKRISLGKMNYAWVAPFSDGKVCMYCRNGSINDMDVSRDEATWTPIPVIGGQSGPFRSEWVAGTVDTEGAVFPKDTIVWLGYSGVGAMPVFTRQGRKIRELGTSRGAMAYGDTATRTSEVAHYPWTVCINPHSRAILFAGAGGAGLSQYLVTPRGHKPSYFDLNLSLSCGMLWRRGAPDTTPLSACRSLQSVWTYSGASWMGQPSFDEMAFWSDADINAKMRDHNASFTATHCEGLRWWIRSQSIMALTGEIPKPSNQCWSFRTDGLIHQPTEFYLVVPDSSTGTIYDKYGWLKSPTVRPVWHPVSETVQGITYTRAVIDSQSSPYQSVGVGHITYAAAAAETTTVTAKDVSSA